MSATGSLPPRPDPTTGEPWPPGPDGLPPAAGPSPPARPRRPPEGRGPVLAGWSGWRAAAGLVVGGAAVAVVALVAVPLVVLGLGWGTVLVLLFPVIVLGAWFRAIASGYVGAGADWLQVGRRWVDLYELVEVRVRARRVGPSTVSLEDAQGRRLVVDLLDLRRDLLVWDLVRLGIRWSCATREVRTQGWPEAADDPRASVPLRPRRPVVVEHVRRERAIVGNLPEKPDPRTCRPFPPIAPWTSPGALTTFPRRPLPPPPGRGPVFAGRSGGDGRGIVLVGSVVLAGPAGLWWAGAGPVVVLIAAALLGSVGWVVTRSYSAVGADWVADERGWVDHGDLVAVRMRRARWWRPGLELTDGAGRRVVVPVRTLLADPLLGMLVHLGIRWSLATNVVEIDEEARGFVERGEVP